MSQLCTTTGRLACALVIAGTVLGTAVPACAGGTPKAPDADGRAVYFDGRYVELTFTRSRLKWGKAFAMGPWTFANRITHDKPRDGHPNFYIVVRGNMYTSDRAPEYDHNEIISMLPVKPDPLEWDVYWALVLDPSLSDDFRSENQLLLSAQKGFQPGDDFDFSAIPSAAVLREFFHVDTVDGLERFRRPDGTLPRVAIVQAGFSMRGSVFDPSQRDGDDESSKNPHALSSVTNPQ